MHKRINWMFHSKEFYYIKSSEKWNFKSIYDIIVTENNIFFEELLLPQKYEYA